MLRENPEAGKGIWAFDCTHAKLADGEAQRHVSSTDGDPDFQGLTLYEKKSLLVDRELDQQGMGKYQWCIFFLCGFGYFLDLLWAQAFGLVVSPMQQEFGFDDVDLGNLFTCFSAGLTAGAFVWGFLVDIIGRYWAFNFTVLWSSLFGLVLGAPSNYTGVLVLTAFIGIGIGGNIPIDTTICLECLPRNRRWLLPALSIFQPIGVVVSSGIAFAFVPRYSCAAGLQSCNLVEAGQACCAKADNYGWRYLLFTLGAITMFIFVWRFFFFRFQESPKYLLYRGKDAQALASLRFIANFNGQQCNVTPETFSNLTDDNLSPSTAGTSEQPVMGSGCIPQGARFNVKRQFSLEKERHKIIFNSPGMIRLVILLWVIYGFDYWGFSIAGSFLPTILARKGSKLGMGLEDTYRSYVFIYLFGIPGVILGSSIYGWRRASMLLSSALFASCLFIFTVVHSERSYIGSMFNAILYGATPEFFPAPIRGTACGVASFWGRIFSIIAPIAGAHVLTLSLNGVLYMAGAGVFVCTIAIMSLPGRFLQPGYKG
ncbi:major facilitator superfamily domain-containing protein [Diplogelasinospora grovesii]|uniref:Major facilitator superfamily domain-containing protein n=1 Tax=Diplogelasinospora grovesii TaxID=303347 RepID=A0AAN6MVB7_9PEZI|nr:major facilitator superfamily domain-containing protein [Diplogelasinospora grovesii]